jgi:rod shape-determining protein MreD
VNEQLGGMAGRVLCALAPLVTGLVAAYADLLPLSGSAPRVLAPSLTACIVYFWTVYRPDLLPPLALFVIGVVLDAVGGLPLGLTALALLLLRGFLLSGQRFLLAQPFAVIWACFLPVVLLLAALRWALAVLFWGRLFPVEPLLIEAGLTVAAYPLVGWLLTGLQRRLADTPRAARS